MIVQPPTPCEIVTTYLDKDVTEIHMFVDAFKLNCEFVIAQL